MNIACDARALLGPRTGVGTWTVEIMAGLCRIPGWRVELMAHRPFTPPGELAAAGAAVVPPAVPGLPGTLWLQWVLPGQLRRRPGAIFVGSLAMAPRRCPVPAVVVVHDLTPRLAPHRHTLKNRFCFNAYLEDSLIEAAAVVVPSAATRDVLLELFPRVGHKVRVVGEGASDRFQPAAAPGEAEAMRARYAGGRPYILYLGTIEPRKGIPDLVRAWSDLAAHRPETPDLVLAGAVGWGAGPILASVERSHAAGRIHLAGYVPARDLPALLRSAELFVLPSESEGFGLPLAEAICCGVPSVASDDPALVEVAGGAALHVPANDPTALAGALRRALAPDERRRLREAALERAPALRWEPAVKAWRTLLEELAAGSPERPPAVSAARRCAASARES